MKKLTMVMLAFSAIGLVVSPSEVKADTANIQESIQESYIEGDYNRTSQDTRQRIDRKGRNRGGSVGNVQTSDQYSDVYGNDNVTRQKVRQTNRHRGRRHNQ